jgi:hypothetical protein
MNWYKLSPSLRKHMTFHTQRSQTIVSTMEKSGHWVCLLKSEIAISIIQLDWITCGEKIKMLECNLIRCPFHRSRRTDTDTEQNMKKFSGQTNKWRYREKKNKQMMAQNFHTFRSAVSAYISSFSTTNSNIRTYDTYENGASQTLYIQYITRILCMVVGYLCLQKYVQIITVQSNVTIS